MEAPTGWIPAKDDPCQIRATGEVGRVLAPSPGDGPDVVRVRYYAGGRRPIDGAFRRADLKPPERVAAGGQGTLF